jgi:hypothetical protein
MPTLIRQSVCELHKSILALSLGIIIDEDLQTKILSFQFSHPIREANDELVKGQID